MRLVACIAVAVALLAAAGCSGSVTGGVSSKTAQKPVPAATVKVGDQTVITDTRGRFTIDKVSTGSQQVAVNAEGYGPYSQSLEVQKGDNTLNVSLEDGIVKGRLVENAASPKPIEKALVRLADQKVKLKGNPSFSFTGVPIGTPILTVKVSGHQTERYEVRVQAGVNRMTVSLNLLATVAAQRYEDLLRSGDYRAAYASLHSDAKRVVTLDEFKAATAQAGSVGDRYEKGRPDTGVQAFSPPTKRATIGGAAGLASSLPSISLAAYPASGGVITNVDLENPRMLAKWRSPTTGKTYPWVTKLDRTLTVRTDLGECFVSQAQHLVQIDGRWYIIFEWRH